MRFVPHSGFAKARSFLSVSWNLRRIAIFPALCQKQNAGSGILRCSAPGFHAGHGLINCDGLDRVLRGFRQERVRKRARRPGEDVRRPENLSKRDPSGRHAFALWTASRPPPDTPHRFAARSLPKTLSSRLYESLSALVGIRHRSAPNFLPQNEILPSRPPQFMSS